MNDQKRSLRSALVKNMSARRHDRNNTAQSFSCRITKGNVLAKSEDPRKSQEKKKVQTFR